MLRMVQGSVLIPALAGGTSGSGTAPAAGVGCAKRGSPMKPSYHNTRAPKPAKYHTLVPAGMTTFGATICG